LRLKERLDDAWVEHRPAGTDLVDRLHQPVRVPEAFLEQVGDPGRAVLEQLQRVLGVVVLGQHDDADPRVAVPDVMGELDALGGEARRHPDVEQDDVRHRILEQLQERGSVAGGAEDLDARIRGDHRACALADEVVVLCDHQRDAGLAHGCPLSGRCGASRD